MKIFCKNTLFIFLIFFSCSSNINDKRIINKWYLHRIENLSLDKKDVLGSSFGCPYIEFDTKKTFKTFNGVVILEGVWEFSNNNILLITEIDTSELFIQKITESELDWVVYKEKTKIKFYASIQNPENCD